ncbi:efflux RND transporter periplasmic adaptor subunit [Candidatus Margulisiibacteriota bacterium]
MQKTILPILLISVLLVSSCTKGVSKKTGKAEKAPISIKVLSITENPFSTKLKITSETIPYQDINLSTQAGGYVEKMNFEVGDYVKKGTVLAEINTKMAHASLNAANAAYKGARQAYLRQKRLFRKKLVSEQVYETVKTQYEQAKAQKEITEINYNNSRITAPITGFITSKQIDQNELAFPGAVIYNLVNLKKLKIIVGATQDDIPYIQKKDIKIYIPSLERSYEGQINSISTKANVRNKTFPIEVLFDNYNQIVRAGVLAEVCIPTKSFAKAISIRYDYIIEKGPEKYVFLAKKGLAKLQLVILGERNENEVRIKSGLVAGDKLIIEGHRNIEDGQKIQVIEENK